MEEVTINGVSYIRKNSVTVKADELDGLERCIVRSYGAGVFYGYVKEKKAEQNGVNIVLLKAKRIHYWSGACSLTQLAMEGTKDESNCRITEAIDSQFIANVIEILPMTRNAEENLDKVTIWKK
jgi:hypothetical protein